MSTRNEDDEATALQLQPVVARADGSRWRSGHLVAVGLVGFVVLALVLGILPDDGGDPSVPISLAASPRPSTRPAAVADPRVVESEPVGHVLSAPGMRIHLAVPDRWSGDSTSIGRYPATGRHASLGLTSSAVSYVVTDACTSETGVDLVEVGPTVEDLSNALVSQIGIQWSGPTDVLVGGYPAKRFVMTLPPACSSPVGHGIWADATRTYSLWLGRGETGTVYVIDVGGTRLVLTSQHGELASADDIAILEAIVASIDIELLPEPEPEPRADVGSGCWLPIGTHAMTVDGVPLQFSVPALLVDRGWARYRSIYISKDTVGSQGAEAVIFWTAFPDGMDSDPCAHLRSLPVGGSAADLAAAVSTAPGTELMTGPTDVTVGGRAAKQMVLTVRTDLGCDPGYLFTWDPAPGGPGWWTTNVGDTIRVWIVDVDGTRLVIVGESTTDAGSVVKGEIQQIVDSIEFE